MRKDKEFKAKNRDTDFSKPQVTDTVLGRHNQPSQQPEVKTPERKNRLYRQENTETQKQGLQQDWKQEFTESKDASLSDTVHTVTENSEQDNKETCTADTDIKPQSSQGLSNETYTPKESPNTTGFSSAPHIPPPHKKKVQRKQAEKYRQETASEPVKNTDTVPQEQPADIPPPKSDRYDISEAAKSTDNAFDRVTDKKTDFQLGKKQSENFRQAKTEHKAKFSQSKKNRLYQKEQKKTVLQNDKTDKPADFSDTDISSADIVTKKETASGASETKKADISEVKKGADKGIPDTDISEDGDFQFTRTRKKKKADRLKSKADKAENKLPHKTKIKRKRTYDEQKKKPKNRLQFEKEVKPLNESNRYSAVKNARSYIGYEEIKAFKDIKLFTEKLEHENENLQVISMQDSLTGIQNRLALRRDFDLYNNCELTVMMLDLDNFKMINDTYGHAAGDRALRETGVLLARTFAKNYCYRYGGDEFLVVCPDLSETQFLEKLKIMLKSKPIINIDGQTVNVDFSAGYVHGTVKDTDNLRQFLTIADKRMYASKNKKQ